MIPGFTTTNFGWSFYNNNGKGEHDDSNDDDDE